jgi:predicted nucleic acid-binding protein
MNHKVPRIYLDCCSIQRPFDDRSQARIAIEAEAILAILGLCKNGRAKLLGSEVLLSEINRTPNHVRKNHALGVLVDADEIIPLTTDIEIRAAEYFKIGVKPYDALHLATASIAGADYFCTCDDKFLKAARKAKSLNVKPLSPLDLIMELEP